MKNMRKKEFEISKAESQEILKKGQYGILSTVDGDGQPYGIPVNYVLNDNAIFFHSALEGHKLDNIMINDRVAFTVVGQAATDAAAFTTKYQSVVAFGKATVVDEANKVMAMKEIVKKYSSDYQEKAEQIIEKAKSRLNVVRIDITYITGKKKG